jgi:hypothetical protein
MTMLYPIVLETEESGAVSAYVPGLPVYAAAETHAKAERAIRAVLTKYLNAHPALGQARGSVWHASPAAGRGRSRSLASPPWLAPIGAPPRHAPRETMAGLVADPAMPGPLHATATGPPAEPPQGDEAEEDDVIEEPGRRAVSLLSAGGVPRGLPVRGSACCP